MASTLGYTADCKTFKEMPPVILGKIFRQGYWIPMGCDSIKNQAVANTLASWAWGSGVAGAKSSAKKFLSNEGSPVATWAEAIDTFNAMAKKDPEGLFSRMAAHRLKFYQSLNQPTFINGWTNRLADFIKFNKDYIKTGAGIIGSLLALAGIFFLVTKK